MKKLLSIIKKRKPRVYIFGGYGPNGGTFVTYQVGRLIAEEFGYQPFVAGAKITGGRDIFKYELEMPVVSRKQLLTEMTDKDVLICNPSFSNQNFGLRLPGTKICYAQGFSFVYVDPFFDHYFSVGNVVKDYLKKYYLIDSTIIPSYAEDAFYNDTEWEDKQDRVVFQTIKPFTVALTKKFIEMFKTKYPETDVNFEVITKTTQDEVARTMSNSKYFVALYPHEGFSSVLLEAVAAGCCIVGFHAWGPKDYLRHNQNSMITSFPKLEEACDMLNEVLHDRKKAAKLATNAKKTAENYTLKKFRQRWKKELKPILGT